MVKILTSNWLSDNKLTFETEKELLPVDIINHKDC